MERPERVSKFGPFFCFCVKTELKRTNRLPQGDKCTRRDLFLASGGKGGLKTRQKSRAETLVPHSPEQKSGKQCWLRDPVRPCVFWVITGFGIPSAGRGHAVETGVLEPVPRWGPILLLLFVLLILLLSFTLTSSASYSVCVSTCPSQTAPSEEFTQSLPPFVSFFFPPSWPSRFLYHFYLTRRTLLLLPHALLYVALMPHNRPQCWPL